MHLARHLMSTNVVTVKSTDSLQDAYGIMRKCGIRHLPVLDDSNTEHLVGMLSWEDVLLCAEPIKDQLVIPRRTVASAMSRHIVSCFASSTIEDIATTMVAQKIDAMPVLEDERLVGIITSIDLIDRLCREDAPRLGRVKPLDVEAWDAPVTATFS